MQSHPALKYHLSTGDFSARTISDFLSRKEHLENIFGKLGTNVTAGNSVDAAAVYRLFTAGDCSPWLPGTPFPPALHHGISRVGIHYTIEHIQGRHFVQTAERAGLPSALANDSLAEVARDTETAIKAVESQLPSGFPEAIHESVTSGILSRLKNI